MYDPNQIQLSPSSLNLFLECPRCFWLYKAKNIRRPAGPFPSLPGGMDLLIKKHFDKYRALGKLPPEIEGKIEGQLLPDLKLIENWRDWRYTSLKYEDQSINAVLTGGLDDCLIQDDPSGSRAYIPIDFKTRGFARKEDTEKYFQNQMDCYTLLLEGRGFKHLSFSYLIFYIPKEVKESGVVQFDVEPVKVKTNPQGAKALFESAVKLLRGPIPLSGSGCQFCSWSNTWQNFK